MTKLVLIEPPARTSNEYELWRAIPGYELTVVSDRDGWGTETEVLGSRGIPLLGRFDGWTASQRWLRGMNELELGGVACAVTLELFSVVSTTSGAIPEVVPGWNPLVGEGDVSAMAAGLVEALGPDGDDWGCRNRLVAVERYDTTSQALKLRAALDAILADG